MFGEMGDPMDFDPNTIQDWDKVQDMGQHAVAEGNATTGMGSLPPETTGDQIPGGAKLTDQFTAAAPKVPGILDKIAGGIKAGSETKIAAHKFQLQQQLQQGAISQALFNAQMSKLMQGQRAGFFQRNMSIIVIGALVIGGGYFIYRMSRGRRRY